MRDQTIRAETLTRELEAERDFWRGRALQLSDAVTALSERVAALESAQAPGVVDAEVSGDE